MIARLVIDLDTDAIELTAARRGRNVEQARAEVLADCENRLHDNVRHRDGVERGHHPLLGNRARVSQRLGHSKVEMTLNIYAHVLPDMQQDAAARIGALLHG